MPAHGPRLQVCAEGGIPLLSLSPSALLSKWCGESERAVRDAFQAARALQPCAVFLDEVDSLAPQRRSCDDPVARRVLTELLIQMSALGGEDRVFVLAATNRIEDLDEALLRRFDRCILVGLPDAGARREFLDAALSRPELQHDLAEDDVADLVRRTEGYSGELGLLLRWGS